MNTLELPALAGIGSLIAGFLGSLTGLGGGVIIVPLLTLGFGVDIHYAIGAAVVSVIATSTGAAAAYVREGYTNIRVGMVLEIATTIGALVGAGVALYLQASVIAVVFGAVLIYSAYTSAVQKPHASETVAPNGMASWLRLSGSYPTPSGLEHYHVRGVPLGFALMLVAGILSGLLGIGSGAVKVLAMDKVMRLPFKVSTTTSNFMIGVTAAAGAGILPTRLYRPGAGDAGHVGSAAGVFPRSAPAASGQGARFAPRFQRPDRPPRSRDDL